MSARRPAPLGAAARDPDSGDVVVALDRVTFSYPGATTAALEAVSLVVRQGEAIVLAGESGSGKSTLARLVCGLLRASDGTVRTGGVDAATARRHEVASIAGLVFQNPNHQLFASTVRDELALGPRNLGVDEQETGERVAAATLRLGLEAVLGEHPYRLAMAMRKRVALAAVLAMRPRVLVLDEPTTGHGRAEASAVATLLREEAGMGTAVITITHDMRFAIEVADRLVVLRAGRVIADGSMREVIGDERLLGTAGLEPPQLVRLAGRLGVRGPLGAPLDEDELVDLLDARRAEPPLDGGTT